MPADECRARLNGVQCQRSFKHAGPHRAEVADPVKVGDTLEAQVLSWD